MTYIDSQRRSLITAAGAGLLVATVIPTIAFSAEKKIIKEVTKKEVSAVEDLMREHGVLRRALLIYRQAALKLRKNISGINPEALHQTAILFRTFGEDYHEKMLEETYIFPIVRKAKTPAATYPDILTAQHNRGREITDFIISVTKKSKINTNDAEHLARAFESLDLMYENHAAREDTIVFPAWKEAISNKNLEEMAEKFEEIEQKQFGKDGFEDAIKKIANIEEILGYSDISQFTAA